MFQASFVLKKINNHAVLTAFFIAQSLFSPCAFATDEKFNIQEVPLSVEHKYARYQKMIPEVVHKIIATPQYAAFVSNRELRIKFRKKRAIPLSKLVDLPPTFDWYETACLAGDKLLVSVGTYSEEQRQKDLQADRGGYVEGPRPVGMLIVQFNPVAVSLISLLNISKTGAPAAESAEPDVIRPKFQSCFSDGEEVYLGEYGYLARMDLDSMTAELLEFDDELMINRVSIWKKGKTLWYAADEGGAGGSWIAKLDLSGARAKRISGFSLMNDGMTLPDSILDFKGRLLASSLAGVVEIDEPNRMFIQYRLTKDRKTMRVYSLSVVKDQLWGLREDGWVRFDLDKRKAVHYHLKGDASSNVQSIGFFEGEWFVGTDKGVVNIK